MKSIGRYILSLLFVVSVLFGCEKQPVEQVRLEIDRTNMKMTVGQTQKLNAELKGAEGEIVWTSDAPEVAEVDADGVVTAVSAGKANILASGLDQTKTCAVEVVNFMAAKLELNEEFEKESANRYKHMVAKGDLLRLEPKFYNADGEKVNDMAYPKYEFVDAEQTVASVDEEGVIEALAPGVATIRISGAEQEAFVTLTVKSVELSRNEMTLWVNQQEILTATVLPQSLSDSDRLVMWSSSDKDFVSVSGTGVVTALRSTEGREPVSIMAVSGDVAVECKVTVSDYKVDEIVVTNIDGLKAADDTYQMLVGDKPYTLDVKYVKDGEDVTQTVKDLGIVTEYSSSSAEVASVTGGVITAKGHGQTEITVSCAGESFAFTLNVVQCVESVVITSPANPYLAGKDESFTIEYKVLPENASVRTAVFESENTDVAVVDRNTGEVTVMKEGQTVIKVISVGTKMPFVNASGETVVEPATANLVLIAGDDDSSKPTSLSITGDGVENGSLLIKKGSTSQLDPVVEPADYAGGYVWSSSDQGVASITDDGLLTAESRGETEVVLVASGTVAKLPVRVYGIDPTAIKIDQTPGKLETADQQYQLTASVVAPDNADLAGVNWYSSADEIASVDSEGLVHLHKQGKVTITAKAISDVDGTELSSVTASVEIEITASAVSQVVLTPGLEVEVGMSTLVTYQVLPSGAQPQNVSWTIEEGSEYAKIDGSGYITGLKSNKLTDPVTGFKSWESAVVKISVDGIEATTSVRVIPLQPTDIIVDLPEDNTLKVFQSWDFNPRLAPDNLLPGFEIGAYGSAVGVNINNYSQDRPGTYSITFYTSATDNLVHMVQKHVSINVLPYWVTGLSIPKTLSLAPDSFTTLDVAFTSDGGAGVAPSDKSVIWTSSDQSVVTVDSKTGEITAHAPGKATVTVTTCGQWSVPSGSPHLSASCEVTVKKAEVSVNVGDYYYSDGTWSSDLKADKTVVGIVFSAANAVASDAVLAADHPDCSHGLVMGLSELTDVQFYTGNASMKTTHRWLMENGYKTDNESYVCGYGNTKGYEALNAAAPSGAMPVTVCDKLADYPAAAPSASSGWYVPSYKEMYLIGQQMAKLNESLTAAGGTVLREIHKYVEFDEFYGKDVERSVHQQYWHSTYQYLSDSIFTKGFNMQSKGWHSVITIATSKWPVRVVLAF